jgi:hypothetical protein
MSLFTSRFFLLITLLRLVFRSFSPDSFRVARSLAREDKDAASIQLAAISLRD